MIRCEAYPLHAMVQVGVDQQSLVPKGYFPSEDTILFQGDPRYLK